MRQDFVKVLSKHTPYCDRSIGRIVRQGRLPNSRRMKMNRRLRLDADYEEIDAPFRSSVSRYNRDPQFFLEPLRGWLAKNVGRKWDLAYRELVKQFRRFPDRRELLLRWLDGLVVRACLVEFDDGKPVAIDSYRLTITSDQLYVDPRDGLLKWGVGRPANCPRLARHSPAAQQRLYKPLPKTGERRLVVPAPEYYANGDSLLYWKAEERCWYRKWSYTREYTEYVDFYGFKRVTETVEIDEIAKSRTLKMLGFRPPRKRRK